MSAPRLLHAHGLRRITFARPEQAALQRGYVYSNASYRQQTARTAGTSVLVYPPSLSLFDQLVLLRIRLSIPSLVRQMATEERSTDARLPAVGELPRRPRSLQPVGESRGEFVGIVNLAHDLACRVE